MGTMTEIKENVEECGNTSGLAVCLSPRRRVTEEIHWLCYHGKVISSSFFGLRWIYLFIFGCAGSSLLREGFLQLWIVRTTLQLWCVGFSLQWLLLLWSMGSSACGLQQLWHTGLAAPCHVGSSQTRSNPCPLHWQCIFNHWTTREAPLTLCNQSLKNESFPIYK